MQPIEQIIDSVGNVACIRDYQTDTDLEPLFNLLREIHWVDKEDSMQDLDKFLKSGRTIIGSVNGSLECLTGSYTGSMRYLAEDIPLSAVTYVATGLAVRRRGLAKRLTANLLANDALDGASLAMLGVFDQGFYDKIGFGSGAYQFNVRCDLGDMRTVKPVKKLPPAIRLTHNDAHSMHSAMLKRKRGHGSCNIFTHSFTEYECKSTKNSFGLGYKDTNGQLTHFLFGEIEDEDGPLFVTMMAWQTQEQLIELLSLLSTLGDQICIANFVQPRDIQIQDLLTRPLKNYETRGNDKYSTGISAISEWQVRILNLQDCMSKTHIPNKSYEFNLLLKDPISAQLSQELHWQGLGGEWTVGIGRESYAKRGFSDKLPNVKASIGAFTRLWIGSATASGLSVTDDLSAEPCVIEKLDELFSQIPMPMREWGF